MAATTLNFQGINRAISDYGNPGACEELINLRPTTAGLVPVKPFSVKKSGIDYAKVFVHYAGTNANNIGIKKNAAETELDFYIINDNGEDSLLTSIDIASGFSLDSVHVASAGNILLFSIADPATSLYSNLSFIWERGTYRPLEADIPTITPTFTADSVELKDHSGVAYDDETSQTQIADIINTGLNAIQEENKDYLFGPVILAIAFKTNDSKTFWTGQWFILNPIDKINAYGSGATFHVTESAWAPGELFTDFFEAHPEGGYFAAMSTSSGSTTYAAGLKVKMQIPSISGWDQDTSMIKSVEIYASRPILYMDAANEYGQTVTNSGTTRTVLPQIAYKDMDFGNQLLYLQKSISLKDLSAGAQSFDLEFGGNIQTTNTTLEVDAGMVQRFGNILSYNARFHYYDSVAMSYIGMPGLDNKDMGTTPTNPMTWYVYARYDNGGADSLIYIGTQTINTYVGGTPLRITPKTDVIISPSLNIKEIILMADYTYNGGTLYALRKYSMVESDRYNYTYNCSGPYSAQVRYTETSEVTELKALRSHPTTSIKKNEPDAINVTEQYNPFVFRVEHSYLAPGRILDVQPQLVQVSDVSFGEAPLNVFTNRGVYALLQGSGTVLYGNFRPISNLVTSSNSVPTEHGTFILAAGGLWAIMGRQAVLISDALSLGPHKYIRSCGSYVSISHLHYNVAPYESAVDFETFLDNDITKATLSYNRFRDELIISNPTYNYCYVLSLKYRQWFKIPGALSQDTVGGNIALTRLLTTTYYTLTIVQDDEYTSTELQQAASAIVTDLALTTVTAEEMYNSIVESISDDHEDFTLSIDSSTAAQRTQLTTDLTTVFGTTDAFSITTTTTTSRDMLDFSDETENTVILVHLQSRPFSFGYQYSHIHRIVSMIRATLTNSGGDLTVALYGSDDLQTWHLLTYANRVNVDFSQMRTAPAARSWRYYTLCIGGTCKDDTDFGPTIVDYEQTIRRLG